jgi:hypothetical protein
MMKKLNTTTLAIACAVGSIASANAAMIFSESFESTTAPDAGGASVTGSGMTFTNWVTANTGFGGAFNSIAVTTEGVDFNTSGQAINADGTQFYVPGTYSGDSGLTTKQGAIATIAAGTDYTFSFAAAMLNLSSNSPGDYDFQIWALDGLADSGRRDSRSEEASLAASGTLLHRVFGSVTSNDFTNINNIFSYTLTAVDAADYIGQDLAIRIDGVGNEGVIDNVQVTAVPEPSTTALLGLGGLALILRRRK